MNNDAKFEIVIQLRDQFGKPTGKIKSFKTDHPEELENFWLRNNMQNKKNSNLEKKNSKKKKNE